MKKIIVDIKPFILNQKVQLYSGSVLTDEYGTTIPNLPYILQRLCKEHEIEEVYLHGGRFAKRTAEKLTDITKFDNNKINITLLDD